MLLHALFTLVRKELQTLFATSMGRRMLVLPVLLQLLLFPFAATLEVKNSTLAIFNQDTGADSIELVQRLAAAQAFPKVIMVYADAQLRDTIDRQKALLAIRIPSDFSRRLERGQSATVQAIIDGRRSNSAQIAFSYAQQIVSDDAVQRAGLVEPAQIVVRNLYNPNLEYRWFILPSLVAIITTIGALMVTALSLAREREQGTFDQLLVSPLTAGYIMTGKGVAGVLVAIAQGSIIVAASVFVYRVPFTGSVGVLYLAMLLFGFALSGFGLFISSLCTSQQQAFLGAFAFMSPAVILSGYLAPVENMPLVLRLVSAADPITHFIIVVKGIFLKGYGFAQAWPHMWPLLAIGCVSTAAAYLLFRHRSGS